MVFDNGVVVCVSCCGFNIVIMVMVIMVYIVRVMFSVSGMVCGIVWVGLWIFFFSVVMWV